MNRREWFALFAESVVVSVKLGSNILALKAQRQLGIATDELSSVHERLASGQRINRASDDAAGIAVVAKLNTDQRVFSQGVKNLNDGISLVNVADGAIESLSNIVIRLKELSAQSANGVYSTKQREALDKEAQALSKEFTRIVRGTKFNGSYLFYAEKGEIRLQGGYGIDGSIGSTLGGAIGTGTLGAPTIYADSSNETKLADLNGDGILDLVTAGGPGVTARATVRLGIGDGTFGASTDFTFVAAGAVFGLALGDVNNDGILDIVGSGTVSAGPGFSGVLLGRGDGTFNSSITYLAEPLSSEGLQLGDLNNDGFLDLVTSGRAAGSGAGDGYITVRLGQGNGTFGAARSYVSAETSISYELALGDINNDGILDVISAGETDASSGVATVRLGLGDGTFGSITSYATETGGTRGIVLEDLNGDGILDLATSGFATGPVGYATIRLGRGDGTFGAAVSYGTESGQSQKLQFGDLNGDGLLDLVTVGGNATPDGFMTVRLGNGDGSFAAGTSYTAQGFISTSLAIGDLNGDGVPDIALSGITDAFGSQTDIRLGNTASGIHPLLPFNLKTQADALQALPILDRKLTQLSQQRGKLGAFQSRLTVAKANLESASLNSRAAANRISDADIAEESSKLVRLSILQKAGAAILAQANIQPQIAINLLNIEN